MIPTEILRIVKGIPKLPGDENSAESALVRFALHMENGQGQGFSLDPTRAWQPARPVVKSGQWADSNQQDGRTLEGNAVGNVRETINIRATAGSYLELSRNISDLQRLANDAQLFHSSFHQIDPVYLEWAMAGGKGSQYALIYDIEISVTYNDKASGGASASIVLVIEREPAWRGIPPGANPRLWTYYWRKQGNPQYPEFDLLDATLPALVEGSFTNANEFDDDVDGYLYPSLSQNYIDIPAEDIPGDAPALVHLVIDDTEQETVTQAYYISRSTKPEEVPTRNGLVRKRMYAIPLADYVSSPTGFTATAESQGPRRYSDGSRYVMRTNTTAGDLEIGTSNRPLNQNAMRGKYNLFIRANFVSTPASGELAYAITFQKGNTAFVINSPPVTTDDNNWHYIGVVSLPLHHKSDVIFDGRGLNGATDAEITIYVEYTNSTSVNCDLYDLIFVPFDEPSIVFEPSIQSDNTVFYDNTGYSSHGAVKHLASSMLFQNLNQETYDTLRGDMITLLPNQYNSLVFWLGHRLDGNNGVLAELNIMLNIVPRWYGIRDA